MAKRKGRSVEKATRLRGGWYQLPPGGYASNNFNRKAYRNQIYTRTGSYGGPNATRTPEFKEYQKQARKATVGGAITGVGMGVSIAAPEVVLPGAAISGVGALLTRSANKKADYVFDRATGTKRSVGIGYYTPKGEIKKSFTQKHPHFLAGATAAGLGALVTTYKTRDQFGRTQYGNFAYDKAFNSVGHWSERVAANRAAKAMGPISDSLELDIRRPKRVPNLASYYDRSKSVVGYAGGSSPSSSHTGAKIAGIGLATAAAGYGGYQLYQHRGDIKNKLSSLEANFHKASDDTTMKRRAK